MRILIVDDDNLVTNSLKTILESDADISVIATGSDGKEAISLYGTHLPDLLLMDIRMQEMNGTEAAKQILEKYPSAKILFLTTFSDDQYIAEALRIGVKGYLLKQNFSSIIPSVKAVLAGQSVFGDEIITKIPSILQSSNDTAELLERYHLNTKELEIISHIANGLSNKEIADKLYLSEGTVRNYISTILEKLELRDRTQLAIFYYKNLM